MTQAGSGLHRLAYWALLGVVSLWILAIFLRPAAHHVGINEYEPAKFVAMVEGTAHQPWVHRALLPLTTRGLSALVSEETRASLTAAIENRHLARRTFERLHWEAEQAHRYLIAAVLMLLSYVGFAHYTARLAIVTCALGDTPATRATIGVAALLGLPPFFLYTSFPYDPPQLFLFTLALYLLATHQVRPLAVLFVPCCLNKETAILLIPIAAITLRDALSRRQYRALLAWLVLAYVAIKLALVAAFRSNPGSVAELHGLDHNVHWLTRPWTLPDVVAWSVCAFFFLYLWREKPRFLRVSFVCTLPPLVALALLFGYVDEWRGYYEAYPVAVALAADTTKRLLASNRAG